MPRATARRWWVSLAAAIRALAPPARLAPAVAHPPGMRGGLLARAGLRLITLALPLTLRRKAKLRESLSALSLSSLVIAHLTTFRVPCAHAGSSSLSPSGARTRQHNAVRRALVVIARMLVRAIFPQSCCC